MGILKHRTAPTCSWIASIFSVTLVIFYLIEIAFVFLIFAIVSWP